MSRADDGWEGSAEAWIRSVDDGELNRTAILDPVMLELCRGVRGETVLDVGCGEGRFCRMLSDIGATTIGIDPTLALIRTAKARHSSGHYIKGSAVSLPVGSRIVDRVVSYVTLVDIPDYRGAIREMVRVLRPGGSLLVANLNGFASSSMQGWYRNDAGEKLHFPVDNYTQERSEWVSWKGIRILNWHRPLSAYMETYLDSGLRLETYKEPTPSEEWIRRVPTLEEDVRVPLFNVMVWRK